MKKAIQEYCVGCGLCASFNKAKLDVDSKGYLRPVEGDETWLKQVCPLLEGKRSYEEWGHVYKLYYGWSSDDALRTNASSGGILTELATFMIERGFVDYVLHTCVDPQDPTKTISCISHSRQELFERCGSRYSISHPLQGLNDLDLTKRYLFIGKPCDVAALRHLQDMDNSWKSVFPYMFSFFCAGLPSKQAQDKLLETLNVRKDECKSLRYRGNGWPGFATVVDTNLEEHKIDYDSSWGKILGRDVMKACRFCMDGIGEAADIACADGWFVTDSKPDFSEHEGRNLIFVRTPDAHKILVEAFKNGVITIEKTDFKISKLEIIQKYQRQRRVTMYDKMLALRLTGRPSPQYSMKALRQIGRGTDMKTRWSIFTGTIKRIVRGRI